MTTTLPPDLSAALTGRYTLERELGGGGMSRVFLARELALGRNVVLKVLPDEMASGVSAERFAREIQLAASLSQANIVPLLAAGDAGGASFYTMPFVTGDSLRHRMQGGTLPAAESIGVLRDIARALAYAHDRGVVHRDIKPENVLLSHGAAVVTDFGIAKAIAAAREGSREIASAGTLTQFGTSIGTPAYMAPEQAVGGAVDARADLYSWGVVAYELLAGRHPFADRTTAPAMIAAHVGETPASLLELLPADARRDSHVRATAVAAMRCLAKSPSDRPDSAATLLASLNAHNSSSQPRTRTAIRAGVGIAIAFALVIASVLLTRRSSDRANATARLRPNRVVVATFVNRTGDAALAPVGLMAADWIARGLATAQVVEVAGTAADLASRGIATADSGAAARTSLAENANAGLVIAGTYYRQGDSLLLQADILDANDGGRLVQTVGPVSALASAPLAGVEALRKRVVGGLAVLVDSSLVQYASRSTTMPSYEAYREFLQGEQLYYRDPAAARDHYGRATALDSGYQWPVLRLLNNAYDRGDGVRMDSIVAVLRARRAQLSPYEAAYLDLLSCSDAAGRAEQCIEIAGAMRRAAPRSQFAAHMTALTLRMMNHPVAAESVFRTLDRRGGELRGRTTLYLHYASTELQLGHDSSALALAREGNVVAGTRTEFLFFELAALAHMRRFDEMTRTFDSAWAVPADRRANVAIRGANVLYVLRHQGDSARADAFTARLLAALATRTTPEAASARGRGERMAVLMAARRWADLEALTDSMTRGGDDRVPLLRARGVALAALGRRDEALAVARRLEHPTRPVQPIDGCSLAWTVCRTAARAEILAVLGQRAEAASLLEDRMYRIFVNSFAEWGVLGEWLRGEPTFEEYVRPRG